MRSFVETAEEKTVFVREGSETESGRQLPPTFAGRVVSAVDN